MHLLIGMYTSLEYVQYTCPESNGKLLRVWGLEWLGWAPTTNGDHEGLQKMYLIQSRFLVKFSPRFRV